MNRQILLIADSPGWAFDFLARDLAKQLSGYSATIEYIANIKDDPSQLDIREFDLVYFYSWFDAVRFSPQLNGFSEDKICVGIHSIESWRKRGWPIDLVRAVCECFAATGFISNQIGEIVNASNGHYTPNGVSPTRFPTRQIQPGTPLKCLWVGNPSQAHHGDIKGFRDYVEPVLSELTPAAELIVASPENFYEHDRMYEFYHQGHVLLCMSETEGCPLPVLEAMHCGLPVITTRVGVVPELVQDAESGWIIPRDKLALTNALNHLIAHPELLVRASEAAIKAASTWTDKNMALAYEKMFAKALESRDAKPGNTTNLQSIVFQKTGSIGDRIIAQWHKKTGTLYQKKVNDLLIDTFAKKDAGKLKAKPNYINSVLIRLSSNIIYSGVKNIIHTDISYGELPLLLNAHDIKQYVLTNRKTREYFEFDAGVCINEHVQLKLIDSDVPNPSSREPTGIAIPVITDESIRFALTLSEASPTIVFTILRSESIESLLMRLHGRSTGWEVIRADEKIAIVRSRHHSTIAN